MSNRTEATQRKLRQLPPGDYRHCACSRLYKGSSQYLLGRLPRLVLETLVFFVTTLYHTALESRSIGGCHAATGESDTIR